MRIHGNTLLKTRIIINCHEFMVITWQFVLKYSVEDFYKSPRRGVTINNTVQEMYGVATEWEQHRILRSAVTEHTHS